MQKGDDMSTEINEKQSIDVEVQQETSKDTSSKRKCGKIYILGANNFQNELLYAFLEKRLNYPIVTSQNLGVLQHLAEGQDGGCCVLLDLEGLEWPTLLDDLAAIIDQGSDSFNCILINAKPIEICECELLDRGIRGIFYKDDCLELLVKGIVAILNGELWFSRQSLSKCLRKNKKTNNFNNKTLILTYREQDILFRIAEGLSNKEIADELRISLHTVKSHTYNIYKKIEVPSRLQASLWASRHLGSHA